MGCRSVITKGTVDIFSFQVAIYQNNGKLLCCIYNVSIVFYLHFDKFGTGNNNGVYFFGAEQLKILTLSFQRIAGAA